MNVSKSIDFIVAILILKKCLYYLYAFFNIYYNSYFAEFFTTVHYFKDDFVLK